MTQQTLNITPIILPQSLITYLLQPKFLSIRQLNHVAALLTQQRDYLIKRYPQLKPEVSAIFEAQNLKYEVSGRPDPYVIPAALIL